MTAISEYAAKQDAHNAAVDTALTGIAADIQKLNDEIATLQNSGGTISPEDQATLDRLEAKGADVQAKVEQLDALTPPAVPAA